jgi:hypothetical protein
MQSSGMVGLPTQISQRSQVLLQAGTWVQGGHALGSPNLAAVQVGTSLIAVGAPGTKQQPKQSQPLGVMVRQVARQRADWVVGQLLKPES